MPFSWFSSFLPHVQERIDSSLDVALHLPLWSVPPSPTPTFAISGFKRLQPPLSPAYISTYDADGASAHQEWVQPGQMLGASMQCCKSEEGRSRAWHQKEEDGDEGELLQPLELGACCLDFPRLSSDTLPLYHQSSRSAYSGSIAVPYSLILTWILTFSKDCYSGQVPSNKYRGKGSYLSLHKWQGYYSVWLRTIQ